MDNQLILPAVFMPLRCDKEESFLLLPLRQASSERYFVLVLDYFMATVWALTTHVVRFMRDVKMPTKIVYIHISRCYWVNCVIIYSAVWFSIIVFVRISRFKFKTCNNAVFVILIAVYVLANFFQLYRTLKNPYRVSKVLW